MSRSSKAAEGRGGLVQRLEAGRRPSIREMEAAERELARQRAEQVAEQPAGAPDQPIVHVPEPEGHGHGQLVLAYNPATGQAWGFNWVVYPWLGDESVREMASRLAKFLRDPAQECLEFLSPHDGQLHCLTRTGAERVLAVDHARTVGQVAPHSDVVKVVRGPGIVVPGR